MTSQYQDANEGETVHQSGSMGILLSEQGSQDMFPKHGEMREGTVVSVNPTEILVDIGAKSEGVLNQRELEKMDSATLAGIQVGQRVSVCVEDEQDGTLILSLTKAEEILAWKHMQQLFKNKTAHTCSIAGYNRGGLVVDLGRLQGFLPASQVSRERRKRAIGDTPSSRWGEMIGEQITIKVIDADQQRNRLIVSESAAYKEARDARREQLLDKLDPGQVCRGRVASLASFGAFVDIGGADGLIHVSELSWSHVDHPSEVVGVGQEIEVQVLSIDRERKRIALSRKVLMDNPWIELAQTYQEGQLVRGIITRLTKFGAFATIEGNKLVEGLVHISEIADHRIGHPEEVVKEGAQLTLRIIKIDPQKNQLRLSIKAVTAARYADLDYELHEAAERENGLDIANLTADADPADIQKLTEVPDKDETG